MTIPGKDPRLIPYGTSNLGTPPELFEGLIVPNDRFFVRSNGPTPAIDPASWRLRMCGLVERRLELGLVDLQALPRRELTAFLECSGNSRSRFVPAAEGTTWREDAVGNAVWGGASLVQVLDRAGIAPGVVDLVAQGGDFPEMQRGLPLAAARDPDTLLVWEMNGEPLPVPHGGPVRLIVPRWGGIASTKWLVGLEAIDHPFAGFWNADNYVLTTAMGEKVQPVREMPVKSIITSPRAGETVRAGRNRVAGYAWSGFGGITRVEVSTDGGVTWADAAISGETGRLSWVRFEHPWEASPGEARLRARATDERLLTQPATVAWNAKGYQMNAIHEVRVTVCSRDPTPCLRAAMRPRTAATPAAGAAKRPLPTAGSRGIIANVAADRGDHGGVPVGVIHVLPDDQIEELLSTGLVGRIACCAHGAGDGDDRPYVVPLAYGYDGDAVYAHSSVGRKLRMMRAQPLVCFEVDRAEAADRWRSVIAEGIYEELTDVQARERALNIIYPKPDTAPRLDPQTVVYRIRLTAKSGRYEIPD